MTTRGARPLRRCCPSKSGAPVFYVPAGAAALAAALLGIVWSGFAGKLFSFNLNY
jgi:hypothetical protein